LQRRTEKTWFERQPLENTMMIMGQRWCRCKPRQRNLVLKTNNSASQPSSFSHKAALMFSA
uniref:Ovule protein n=1 Tax=Angiostrongylus cantonensis TaxID=6313 RepID=A0A0K0D2A9_ANGCA